MEDIKILIDGVEDEVQGLFYLYDSKYYFVYTEKEVDDNNYVVLYLCQVGRETVNTENGMVDTGYMIGLDITDPNEQQKVQTSISYIVEDKKSGTANSQIQYLPVNMLSNLKIISKKRFRLLKSIMQDDFKMNFDSLEVQEPEVVETTEPANSVNQVELNNNVVEETKNSTDSNENANTNQINIVPDQKLKALTNFGSINNDISDDQNMDVTVIVDYRSKYFEVEEKNRELQAKIDDLSKKLEDIKKIVE